MFGKRTASGAPVAPLRPAASPEPDLAAVAERSSHRALDPVDAFPPEELDPLTPATPKRPDPFEHALGQGDPVARPTSGGAGPRATAGLAQLKNAQAVAEIVREQSDYYHATKTTIFNALMNTIDLAQLAQLDQKAASEEIRDIVAELVAIKNVSMSVAEQEHLVQDILNDVLGYGPLEPLLARDDIADIMVNGAGRVFIEVGGKVQLTNVRFRDNTQLMNICQRIVSQVGRRVDEASPVSYTHLTLPTICSV